MKQETAMAWVMRHVMVDGRHCWHYLLKSDLGELHIVQHERLNYMDLVDDYMGWSNDKADAAFDRMTTRMLRGKE